MSRSRSTSVACQRALSSVTWACQPFCSGESENLGARTGAGGRLRGYLKTPCDGGRQLKGIQGSWPERRKPPSPSWPSWSSSPAPRGPPSWALLKSPDSVAGAHPVPPARRLHPLLCSASPCRASESVWRLQKLAFGDLGRPGYLCGLGPGFPAQCPSAPALLHTPAWTQAQPAFREPRRLALGLGLFAPDLIQSVAASLLTTGPADQPLTCWLGPDRR